MSYFRSIVQLFEYIPDFHLGARRHGGALEKSLAILEFLAAYPEGVALATISSELNQARSGCHRTLQELIRYGYVRTVSERGDYALTTKLASVGLSFLSKSGVVDIAQPVIGRLARVTEEMVRLAIVDGERLTLVAKAQGAKSGLLYDPDMGIELNLSCSAAGHAWLMTLPEDRAIQAVTRQGMGDAAHFGPNAPKTIKALLRMLQDHRKRGFSLIRDVYAAGMSAMAAPVQRRADHATGVVVIAGPSIRLTEQRMLQFGPALLNTAGEIGPCRQRLSAAQVGKRRYLGQSHGAGSQARRPGSLKARRQTRKPFMDEQTPSHEMPSSHEMSTSHKVPPSHAKTPSSEQAGSHEETLSPLADIHALLSAADRIVVMTGAGMSAESGIPDLSRHAGAGCGPSSIRNNSRRPVPSARTRTSSGAGTGGARPWWSRHSLMRAMPRLPNSRDSSPASSS